MVPRCIDNLGWIWNEKPMTYALFPIIIQSVDHEMTIMRDNHEWQTHRDVLDAASIGNKLIFHFFIPQSQLHQIFQKMWIHDLEVAFKAV